MDMILTNKNGQTLDLLNNETHFILVKCDALHGIDTDIATIDSPYLDGAQVEMVRALPRGISMTFKLIPDIRGSIDFFTNVIKSKQFVTLTEKENEREIQIKGVATIPPYTRMLSSCEIQLDIYCGQPYWESVNELVGEISKVLALLYFPMETGQYFTETGRVFSAVNMTMERTFENSGDVAVGMNIKISILQEATTNPAIACSSGEQNGFNMWLDLTLQPNDEVEINTERGNKYIKINGSETYNGQPVLSYLHFEGTDWLQLETGENVFNAGSYDESQDKIIPSDSVYFTITYKPRYE